MSNRIILKQNDLLPVLVATVTNEDGTIVDLTNATAVKFSMRNQYTGTIKISNIAGAFVVKADGTISYTWAGSDTDTIGDYIAEFQITWPSSKLQTAPQKTNLYISIVDGVL